LDWASEYSATGNKTVMPKAHYKRYISDFDEKLRGSYPEMQPVQIRRRKRRIIDK
jgi:hypothetical protein